MTKKRAKEKKEATATRKAQISPIIEQGPISHSVFPRMMNKNPAKLPVATCPSEAEDTQRPSVVKGRLSAR